MNPYETGWHLAEGFLRSAKEHPNRPALSVGDRTVSYRELDERSSRLAATLRHIKRHDDCQFAGFLAHRSIAAYTAVLGTLRAGCCYVPLNPKFPVERTARMISASGMTTLFVEASAFPILDTLLPLVEQDLTLICESERDAAELKSRLRGQEICHTENPERVTGDLDSVSGSINDPAYLLFTSGSTGIPKGVAVSHRNVTSYLDYTADRYQVNCDDRFSQAFDMTFDLSVHDMFLCWGAGACLCCIPERSTMAPARYIKKNEITMWFSVPSVIAFSQRMRLLPKNGFPSIRYSLFCGEPLLASHAAAWQAAANNSTVENLYGPTEATIAITHYRWDPNRDTDREFPGGIVPIGSPFSGQKVAIVDKDRSPVAAGELGELCLGGSQVTAGYLNNPEKTTEQFVSLADDPHSTWYRTGDLAVADDDGCLYYRGRIDNQLQVRGHRVELQEIEHVLRKAGDPSAVAVGWPPNSGNVESIYAVFCQNDALDKEEILSFCRSNLPEYMVPRDILYVAEIPLNANGKVDRRKLATQLKEMINE